MNDNQKWIGQKVKFGWLLLGLGVVAFVAGLLLSFISGNPNFWFRFISAAGILMIALGIAQLIKYRAASRDRIAAQRVVNQERDERMINIRTRAGNRAFWLSILMTYAALMWLSFAGNGSLPAVSMDAMWYYLSAAVVVPLILYVGSVVYDNAHR